MPLTAQARRSYTRRAYIHSLFCFTLEIAARTQCALDCNAHPVVASSPVDSTGSAQSCRWPKMGVQLNGPESRNSSRKLGKLVISLEMDPELLSVAGTPGSSKVCFKVVPEGERFDYRAKPFLIFFRVGRYRLLFEEGPNG